MPRHRPIWRGTVYGKKVVVYERPLTVKGARFGEVKLWGDRYIVSVKPGMKPKAKLDTVIHELLHVADWDKEEFWVHSVATDVTNAIVAMGFGATN